MEIKKSYFREEKIVEFKKILANRYFFLLSFVLFCYTFYFAFYLKSTFMFFYILGGLVLLNSVWFTFRNKLSLNQLVMCYLIIKPLYCFVIILTFWNYTVTNFIWLLSIPIGGYIFFQRKGLLICSIYVLTIIMAMPITLYFVSVPYVEYSLVKIRVSDFFLFTFNFFIFGHLLYYYDKIAKLQILTDLENQEHIELPLTLEKKQEPQHLDLFYKIEKLMLDEKAFKDIDLNISVLSASLKVSTSYISRAIREQDYPNFNAYLNYHRIEYVVKLLNMEDLDKITLLYIYSEAGYKNQSTFNTAFKKLKGVTPSEYLQNIENVIT